MSKEFIEKKVNSLALETAVRQQKQLSYFLTSEIQKDIHPDYFEKYAERKYNTNDLFLNWVKTVFKTENFLSFAKYYRNPNPSASLINNRVEEPLSRVFFSEDSYFNYKIQGKYVEYPESIDVSFQEDLFKRVLYNHNDIIIHDLKDVNKPYRFFLEIDKVVSIKVEGKSIKKIAYTAEVEIDGKKIIGYAYLDDEKYQFFNKEKDLLIKEPHDLGECPATFVVYHDFSCENHVVKKSIFSYLIGDLEEYSFLKTLQKMTDPNGAIPITVKLKTNEIREEYDDFAAKGNEPMSADQLGSQVSDEARQTIGVGNSQGGVLQTGTVISAPIVEKTDGSIDVELAKNFLTFYHAPVEALEYLNKRIKDLEQKIVINAIGDYNEGNTEASMTELQVSKGFVARDDKLRWLSNTMSFSRKKSDTMILGLEHGIRNIECDIFYGSDFFIESQSKLYEMFKSAPNSIERQNILIRLCQRRNMFNKEKSQREVVLYKLLPYSSDEDFKTALENQSVDEVVFEFQTRFNYWIAMFESMYGNILSFWNDMNSKESEKIVLLNNIIFNLINTYKNGKETSN